MKTLSRLEKSFSFWFILLTSFFFFLLRWPSLFEPYWYGDEGVYQAVGMLINNGQSLYSGAWENKPPLLLIIYAFFNSDQFLIRTASLISGLISIWFFYLTARRIFPKSKNAVMIATFVYTFLFGINLIEGNIANAENFMMLPILASVYLFTSGEFIKKLWEVRTYFFAGFILSFAFLTKVVAVFDFLALSAFLFFDYEKNTKVIIRKKLFPFILGFIIPVLITITYFLFSGSFKEFMDAFVLKNVSYVGYENEFFIPQGLLILKFFALAFFLSFLYLRRKYVERNVLLIFIWFGFSLFNAYFSQRPYVHYLIVLLPSFCLMIAVVISQKKEKALALISLVLALLVIRQTFVLKFEKVIPYYSNLIAFYMDKKNLNDYQAFFDRRTPRDYLLANYIKSNTNRDERVFIWGNNAQVYKLADRVPIFRYTVAYHTISFPNGISEMESAIETVKPKYVIIMPDVPSFPLSLSGYTEKMNIEQMAIYEKIF